MFRQYYLLTKPGIIRGNVMTTIAGALLASKGNVDLWLLLAVAIGTALIIASGCVFNNYIDRSIDAKMPRTKKRALVTGEVKESTALIYGTILSVVGFLILSVFTNYLTVLIGAIGIVSYVVVYGWAKRRTVHGTLVGTVPGATSLIAGYCAVTGEIDTAVLILFLIMVCWQMPHFYAIAIRGLKGYKDAGIPVLPAVEGFSTTRKQIIAYIIGFIISTSALTIFGYTGFVYLIVMLAVGAYWLKLALKNPVPDQDTNWARGLFLFSLTALTTFSVMISVDSLLY